MLFRGNRRIEKHALLGGQGMSVFTVHIHWQTGVKFGIRNMYIMLVVISEFHEHRLKGGCTYVVGGNGSDMYSTGVLWNRVTFWRWRTPCYVLSAAVRSAPSVILLLGSADVSQRFACICLHMTCCRPPADRAGRLARRTLNQVRPNRIKPV